MSKFYGVVGYIEQQEVSSGVFADVETEHKYYGDVQRNRSHWDTNSEHLNDDLNVSNIINIVADQYAYEHFFAIRYVEWMGVRWKVTKVEVQRPRLILTIGGVYNGVGSGPETP